MAESAGALPAPVVAPDDRTLFTLLSRPLPSYALEHVFSRHGPIEWVRGSQPPSLLLALLRGGHVWLSASLCRVSRVLVHWLCVLVTSEAAHAPDTVSCLINGRTSHAASYPAHNHACRRAPALPRTPQSCSDQEGMNRCSAGPVSTCHPDPGCDAPVRAGAAAHGRALQHRAVSRPRRRARRARRAPRLRHPRRGALRHRPRPRRHRPQHQAAPRRCLTNPPKTLPACMCDPATWAAAHATVPRHC